MNRDFIESFAAGGDILRRAVQGLSRDDLLAPARTRSVVDSGTGRPYGRQR